MKISKHKQYQLKANQAEEIGRLLADAINRAVDKEIKTNLSAMGRSKTFMFPKQLKAFEKLESLGWEWNCHLDEVVDGIHNLTVEVYNPKQKGKYMRVETDGSCQRSTKSLTKK